MACSATSGRVISAKSVRNRLFRMDGHVRVLRRSPEERAGQRGRDLRARPARRCAELEADPRLEGFKFRFLPLFDQGLFIDDLASPSCATAALWGGCSGW
jgi:hypothetical protein